METKETRIDTSNRAKSLPYFFVGDKIGVPYFVLGKSRSDCLDKRAPYLWDILPNDSNNIREVGRETAKSHLTVPLRISPIDSTALLAAPN